MKWNRGQFMGMVFIVIAVLAIGYRRDLELPAGLVSGLIFLCLVVNIILWRLRHKVSAHAGMQIFLWIGGISMSVILFVADREGTLGDFDDRFSDAPRLQYLALLVFPIISVMYVLINKKLIAKNVVEQAGASNPTPAQQSKSKP